MHRAIASSAPGAPTHGVTDEVGFAMALGHAGEVTAEALAPLGATPFAGLVPWLASLWRRLRASVAKRVATAEEEQVLHLIEFAASRFGDPLLRASSIDDLDDQLDGLVGSPEALYWTALLARHVSLFQASEATSAAHLAESVAEKLGTAQGRVLSESQQVLDAWLDAQRQVAGLITHDAPPDAERIAERIFEFSLASPAIPAELAQLVFHSLRAGFCSLAIARAIGVEAQVEPWLAHALTERLVASAREHLRLLASMPEVTVDEAIVPLAMRLDLDALAARHLRARLASQRSLEQTRTRLGL
jgi:hypothetical protein